MALQVCPLTCLHRVALSIDSHCSLTTDRLKDDLEEERGKIVLMALIWLPGSLCKTYTQGTSLLEALAGSGEE